MTTTSTGAADRTIRIPTDTELADRLEGLDGLLTAKQWERAAIVYAFTEPGDRGAGRWHKPRPPRMNILTFAKQGYAGLSSNKSVLHYRAAWETAIANGWAAPVGPGDTTVLPDQPFPVWKATMERRAHTAGERVFSGIESAALALRRLPFIQDEELTPELHAELRTKLLYLRTQADEALATLQARQPAKRRHLTGV